jgi:hypothetical protein
MNGSEFLQAAEDARKLYGFSGRLRALTGMNIDELERVWPVLEAFVPYELDLREGRESFAQKSTFRTEVLIDGEPRRVVAADRRLGRAMIYKLDLLGSFPILHSNDEPCMCRPHERRSSRDSSTHVALEMVRGTIEFVVHAETCKVKRHAECGCPKMEGP